MQVVPFSPDFETAVVELIVGIQRDEFGIDIDAERQPDLRSIPSFYQVGSGNFWVALQQDRVVGTVSVLDIGAGQGALRKMFVHRDFRGPAFGTARRLLDALLRWCAEHRIVDLYLGTTPFFLAAHRFYEKHGFSEIPEDGLPPSFPIMEVDTRFYHRRVETRVETEGLRLRPAREDDFEFLWRLQCEAMRPNVERQFGPWDEAFQRQLFEENTDTSSQEIIELDQQPIGCQWVRWDADGPELLRLQILPAFQGRGIGSRFVERLIEGADRSAVPVRLQVFRTSPARRLYARLGFETVSRTQSHECMVRAPRPGAMSPNG